MIFYHIFAVEIINMQIPKCTKIFFIVLDN